MLVPSLSLDIDGFDEFVKLIVCKCVVKLCGLVHQSHS